MYSLGRHAYAYSIQARRWDVAELPVGCSALPILGPVSATINWEDHIYIFNKQSGKWKHIDIDAITGGADDPEKESARPQR